MEGWVEGLEDIVWDVASSRASPLVSFLRLLSNTLWEKYIGVMWASFLDDESILVMPRVFADCTLACCVVVYGIITYRDFPIKGTLLCL